MHRTSGALVDVRYGTDGVNLHVRVDLTPEARTDRVLGLELVFPGPPERRARIALAGSGAPKWTRGVRTKDVGEWVAGEIVEIRIPLARLGTATPGDEIQFHVVLKRGTRPEEMAPASGWFHLRAVSQDPRLTHWSAL